MKFSHLHNHTQFSLLDGASAIDRLYKKAKEDGMPGIAITDHGNMFGVFEFVSQAWKNKKQVGITEEGKPIEEPEVKPIIGCEFYLVENRHKKQFSKEDKDRRYHQLLLAKNEIGYRNLVKLCSLGYIEGLYSKYPRIDKELILQYHEGLIATTCCIGASIPKAILQKGEAEAEKEFAWWHNLFQDDFYVELQRHGIADQIKVNDVLLRFARKYNVPIIASNDSHYVDQKDSDAHDTLLCINTGEKKSTPVYSDLSEDEEARPKNGRFGFSGAEFYFKTTQQMSELFHDLPEAIENTQLIVDKVQALKLEKEILLPHFKVPNNFNDDQDAYLEHLTWKGAHERYKDGLTPEIEERIRFELFTIRTMGFAGYFLIVADFINHGKDIGVFVGPGRGSAAGSVVAYCTGITNIDPIKYNLLFERFLNPERKSMPDIDTDFDDEGRQKVIDYVVEKYGTNQVAHIITYGTMAAKMSIKDVSRVMELPLSEANDLAKLVPEKPGISLKRVLHAPLNGEDSLAEKEGLNGEDLANVAAIRTLYENTEMLQSTVLHEAEILEGSVRNTGIHAAGIIIAPKDLTELLPVSTGKDVKLLITQFEGKIIENAGVIKMDFLGLKTLTILKNALQLIKRNYNIDIDLNTIPLDDAATYELYQRGDTNGTFQFESIGMQKYLKDLKPDKFDDLIAMNALYRPGPLEYIPNFIKRKHKLEAIVFDLPEMQEYLDETYGITVYQEQVMLLSQKLAGFSKGDADVLRKAMGKKQKSVLDKMKAQFITGATAKGHPEDKLNKIWTDWEAFAQYAFNKSHSTCYAFVAYQTAYLKAHYPEEYMAAVLNNQNAIDKIKFMMEECQRMGLMVLGPDVNESMKGFSVPKKGVIRFGLNAIKGVGEAAVEQIVEERETNGNFANIFDFIKRINQRMVNKRTLESLVLAGAFDDFKELHRAQYFYAPPTDPITGLERLVRFGNQYQASKTMTQNSLFGSAEMPEVKPPQIPDCETWTLAELLNREKEVVGIYISANPLDNFSFEMKHYGFTPIADISKYPDKKIRIAGFVTEAVHLTSKEGKRYAKMVLNDYTGSIALSIWSEQFVKFGNYVQNGQKLMLQGTYTGRRFKPEIKEFQIQNVLLLEEVKKQLTKRINLTLPLKAINGSFISQWAVNIKNYPGKTELNFHVFDVEDPLLFTNLILGSNKFELNDTMVAYLENTPDIEYQIETF